MLGLRRRWQQWRFRRVQARLAGPRLLAAFAAAHPRPFFVEIGSNDGDHHDHLRPFILERRWAGLMVEPVPYIFERLRANYGSLPGIRLENAAVAERDGTRPFFHVAEAAPGEEARLPHWYSGIGSFSRDVVLGHADHIPDIERRVVETEVPCLSFDSLCARHGVESVDLVLIDTEGYDAAILRAIDLRRWAPRLVVYEHYHLEEEEQRRAVERLRGAGYEVLSEGFDTWAVRTDRDDELTRALRRLRPGVDAVFARADSSRAGASR